MSQKKNHRLSRDADHTIIGRVKQTYQTQAISQADRRQEQTNVALPNDDNVEIAHNWVNFNHK